MDADNLSRSNLTLACSECSHSQTDTTSSPQPDRGPLPYCATCSVLQRCRTNYVPTQAEQAQLDALVEDAQARIIQLNKKIYWKRRPRTRANLEKRRDDLQRLINDVQSLAAPVRKLPPEVLNEIFELLCLSEGKSSLSIYGYYRVTTQTLDLSQVCAFWRAAVLSRPALWAILNIRVPGSFSISFLNEMCQLVVYYLQCSRSQPLNLKVSEWIEHSDLFDRLFAELGRWHDIQFEIPYLDTTNRSLTCLSSTFSAPSQVKFKTLTRLCWYCQYDNSGDINRLLALADFPELLTCRIDSFSLNHLDSVRMPKLTKLELQLHYQSHPLAALLRMFPNLRECQIHSLVKKKGNLNSTLVDYPPHCHLRQLDFGMYPDLASSAFVPFFYSLSLPRLESLSLSDGYYMAGPLPSMGLLSMLDHSAVALQSLTLNSLEKQKVLQILSRLPSLTSLSLQNITGLSSILFEQLTLTSDMPNLIPQLRSLKLVHDRMDLGTGEAWFMQPVILDALCDMVESRCRFSPNFGAGSLLDQLTLSTVAGHGFDVPLSLVLLPSNHRLRECLQPLVDAGLSLQLISVDGEDSEEKEEEEDSEGEVDEAEDK